MKLRYAGCAALLVLAACKSTSTTTPTMSPAELALAKPALAWPAGLPVYDHVVIVVEENKNYEQVIGPDGPAYINRLRAEGANLTRMYGEEHHSEGNYFWLFSGSDQGTCCLDAIPTSFSKAPNLGQALIDSGRWTFKGYAEDLPAIGSTVNGKGLYARKHVPWITFSNVPNGSTVATSSNLRFADFPSDYTKLPTVAFVIPNLINDMHDGDVPGAVEAGSVWLEKNLDAYYLWAKTHNSLLIVTFDENDKRTKLGGPTDPAATLPIDRNGIVTILAGAHIKAGDYPEGAEGAGANHVTLLRTLEAMYGLPRSGAQQQWAEKAGISDTFLITDVFEPTP